MNDNGWQVRIRILDVLAIMTIVLAILSLTHLLPYGLWIVPAFFWMTMIAVHYESRSVVSGINLALWSTVLVSYIALRVVVF